MDSSTESTDAELRKHTGDIYHEEVSNLRKNPAAAPDALLQHIPVFDSMRTSMYRQRHKTVLKLPQTLADINLENEWTTTEADDLLRRLDDGNILLFFTSKNMELLSAADVIFADGTFSSSPRLFDQIYSIHAEYQGHMLPLIYGLLPNRTEATYTSVFDYLKQTAATQGLQLSPDVFQLDFERASHNASSIVFPNTQLRGRFFHYTQCFWRRTQKVGLASEYKSDNNVKRLVR
ncbi:uncharacterized protein LOC124271295 [Haliotis rubra]|uniref:uncharacterized protein LOC124271295 n=1 Tax=Haliotis rubra TaxID=36100 RepID=UPI001EE57D80|nr:uncharacterized protein LOC124271295 [Haliotis rubra]